jgi:hypothetical protein
MNSLSQPDEDSENMQLTAQVQRGNHMQGYNYFRRKQAHLLKDRFCYNEMTRIIVDKWRQLSTEQRLYYEELASEYDVVTKVKKKGRSTPFASSANSSQALASNLSTPKPAGKSVFFAYVKYIRREMAHTGVPYKE